MTEIAQAIRNLTISGEEIYSLVCKVASVDSAARTCVCDPVDGRAQIPEVRLQPVESASTGIAVIPVVGSFVIVTFINETTAYVALCEQIDEIIVKLGGQEINYDDQGMKMNSSSADLKTELNRLIDEVSKLCTTLTTFQVLVPAFGPSASVMPNVIAALQQHKVQIDLSKTNLNTILK